LTLIITSFPPTGRLYNMDGTPISTANPRVTNPNGLIKYTPDKTTEGPSSFTYRVIDQNNGLGSPSVAVLMQLSPTTAGESVPAVRYTDPVWKLTSSANNATTARREATFSVTGTDTNNDPLSIVFTFIPAITNGVIEYNGKSVAQLRDPKCDCIIIVANRSSTGQSTWNFVYQATNPTGVDQATFSVVDRQITSASDLTRYPQYTVVLDANQAGKSQGSNGASSGHSSGGDGGGHGLDGFWIAFIVIVCIILCLLCITCIILAIVLIKKRTSGGRGFRRNGRKPLNDQQYENLGSYSPPDL